MKGLKTLIKLSKRQLDELRRRMTSLENQKAQLEQAIVALRQEVEREMVAAQQRPDMAVFFGGFTKRMKQRELDLRAEIAKVEKHILELAEEIRAAFAEQKKYEIALENAKERERQTAKRREDEMMDEIASQQHHRKTAQETE